MKNSLFKPLLILSVIFIFIFFFSAQQAKAEAVTAFITIKTITVVTTAITGSDYLGCSVNFVWGCDSSGGAGGGATSGPGGTPTFTGISGSGGDGGGTPKGWHDSSSCSASSGWTCDADNYNQAIDVHLYKDGPAGNGTYLGSVNANQSREAAIGAECGGNSNHGFTFNTPDSLKDGQTHRIYTHAINIGSGSENPLLSGTPKIINCSSSSSFSPPSSPVSSPPSSSLSLPSVSTSCGFLTFPSAYWHEIYTVHSNGQCLGERKEDTRWDFDADWGGGTIDFGRGDDVEINMGRIRNVSAGTYRFILGSDDGSRLYIDGEQCVDNWGDHGYQEKDCSKSLSGGDHSFWIKYYENGGGARVSFKTETVSLAPPPPPPPPPPSFNISSNSSVGLTILGKEPETCASDEKNNTSLITVESFNGFNENVSFSITDWGGLDSYLVLGGTYPDGYNFSRNPLASGFYESGSVFNVCLKPNAPKDQYTLKLRGRSQNRGDRYTDIFVNTLLVDPKWREI